MSAPNQPSVAGRRWRRLSQRETPDPRVTTTRTVFISNRRGTDDYVFTLEELEGLCDRLRDEGRESAQEVAMVVNGLRATWTVP